MLIKNLRSKIPYFTKVFEDKQKLVLKSLFTNHHSLITNSGQSLFEVVIAVGLSALILSAVASLSAGTVRNSGFTRNNAIATKYAQEALEWLRSQRDADWTNLSNNIGNKCLNTSPPTGLTNPPCSQILTTVFSRQITLALVDVADPDKIDAEVIVSWTDAQGTHEVKSQTRFTNWR